ncbi:MAG: hypothetical protein PHE56_06280 [Bacteroidales bacterium]|nr:hypothetical protein [Bacteroidales bacterium]
MDLNTQLKNTQTDNYFNIAGNVADEIISIEECKQFTEKFDLDKKHIGLIRNYMIGIIDKTINSYLDNFK